MADKNTKTVVLNRDHEDEDYKVYGINGTLYQIKTDEEVDVPDFLFEAIKNCNADAKEVSKRARAAAKKATKEK